MFDVYDNIRNTGLPVIIDGMGNGADKITAQLEKRNIPVSGFMASDDFVRGQSFHGFTVKKLSDHEKLYDDFVIISAFGTSLPDVMSHIISLSKKHRLYVPDVPVYGDNIWDRDYYIQNREDIERAYEIFADSSSKDVFEKIIKFKLSGELEYLLSSFSDKDEVFCNILKLSQNESYLDLGAYRGDTIAEFLNYSGGSYEHITALEPDIRTYKKLREYASGFPDTQLFNMGIWSNDCDLILSSSLGRGSSLAAGTDSASRSQSQSLAVTCIDTLYKRRVLTYLKMDVEGAEEQALLGGAGVIARDRPKLNIALYHRTGDFFRLPLLIHSIAPEYKLYLRQHPHIPDWDLNLYAV